LEGAIGTHVVGNVVLLELSFELCAVVVVVTDASRDNDDEVGILRAVTGVVIVMANAETEIGDNDSHCTPKATANAPMKKDDDVDVDIIVLLLLLHYMLLL